MTQTPNPASLQRVTVAAFYAAVSPEAQASSKRLALLHEQPIVPVASYLLCIDKEDLFVKCHPHSVAVSLHVSVSGLYTEHGALCRRYVLLHKDQQSQFQCSS